MADGTTAAPAVVTGGAGAIGSALVRRLLRDGRRVRVLDNFSSGRRDALPSDLPASRLAITACDLGAAEPPADAVRGAAEIWHLAATRDVRRGTLEPGLDLTHGTIATAHLLEQARRCDVRRIVYTSSSVVYGLASVQPTPETYGPLLPQSLYGASKLAGEGLVSAYAHSYGLTARIFRLANIVDGRMDHGILHDLFGKLDADPSQLEVLGDGRQAKSYLRTEDCVEGMLVGAAGGSAPVDVFNLGADDRTSVREIAEKVVAARGGRARVVFTGGERGWAGDIPQQLLSIEKIRRRGWAPSTTSGGAIDRTVAELLARRASPG